MRLSYLCCVLVACGSSEPPTVAPEPAAPPTRAPVDAAPDADDRAALVEAHHKLEAEQQEALAATCDEPTQDHARCLPSCYATEPADARAHEKLRGAVEIDHLVCETAASALVLADELQPELGARAYPRRFPRPHKQGSWQAAVETELHDKLARGDAVVVAGAWHTRTHPLTHEVLECVTVAHYTRRRRPLDACGALGGATCEAAGNPAARAINVVHFRLAEARQLQAAGHQADCRQAALEAIAVARGLPRWRQYAKLNVHQWQDGVSYRTRFDGLLDEDGLVAAVAALGSDAEAVYAACGATGPAHTTAEQEQSFHTCW